MQGIIFTVKVWSPHFLKSASPPPATLLRGATHGFGSTLEQATRRVMGVMARDGAVKWDHATGQGRVDEHQGDYFDALFVKFNAVALFLMEISGALSPPAKRHLRKLGRRSKIRDLTPYDTLQNQDKYVFFWTQRLSAAAVTGDARRAPNALSAKFALFGGGH